MLMTGSVTFLYGRVRFDLEHQRNGSKKLHLGIWVNPQYSGKSPVFKEKLGIRVKAQYSGKSPVFGEKPSVRVKAQ